jgi:hypothetical protein
MPETGTILKELPSRTPTWAVGLVSIIVSFSAALVLFYTTVRSEVQTVLKNQEITTQGEININQRMIDSILSLVNSNNQQISNLSASLYAAQREAEKNSVVEERYGNWKNLDR